MGAAAIVLAGGSGTRVGAGRNKVFLQLGGRTVLEWSLAALARAPGVSRIVLVAREADLEDVRRYAARGVVVVTGGATRQESELAGLRALTNSIVDGDVDVVLVHDGARPFVSDDLVAAVLRAAREHGGAVPGVPRDDLAVAGAAGIAAPAEGLFAVQTPQAFRASALLTAYEQAAADGFAGTDTAACVARYAPDLDVRAVPSDPRNLKITFPSDVAVAELLAAQDQDQRKARPSPR